MVTGVDNILDLVFEVSLGKRPGPILLKLPGEYYVGGNLWSIDNEDEDPNKWCILIDNGL